MSSSRGAPPPSRPGELSVEELMLLEKKAPQVYADLMAGRKRQHRLAWTGMVAQIIGNLSGLTALAICAVVAWHAFDQNAPTQGAAIICTGAVSIVMVFVTGKVTGTRSHTRAQPRPDFTLDSAAQPANTEP